MNFSRWILVLFLFGTVLCVASVPPVDDPDTAIDESDFQTNLAIPAPLDIKLVPPVATSVNLTQPVLCDRDWKANTCLREFTPVPKQSRSHSLQKRLCTFLI